jgi:fructose-1,6-bisphosphatase
LVGFGEAAVDDDHFSVCLDRIFAFDFLSTGTDVLTVKRLVDKELERKKVKETNVGEELMKEVAILEKLREYRYMK